MVFSDFVLAGVYESVIFRKLFFVLGKPTHCRLDRTNLTLTCSFVNNVESWQSKSTFLLVGCHVPTTRNRPEAPKRHPQCPLERKPENLLALWRWPAFPRGSFYSLSKSWLLTTFSEPEAFLSKCVQDRRQAWGLSAPMMLVSLVRRTPGHLGRLPSGFDDFEGLVVLGF